MKSRLPIPNRSKPRLALLSALVALLVAVCSPAASAQNLESAVQGCKVGVRAPANGNSAWASNSRVKVYLLMKGFTPTEIAPVLAPLRSWNAVSAVTGSGVILEYAGETDVEQSCENCLTIMRGSVSGNANRKAVGNLRGYAYADNGQIMIRAALIIEPNLANLTELTDVVAHELGHTFGLYDCYTCKSKSTLMNQFKGLNAPNEVSAPTDCDIAQVAATYRQFSTSTSTASLARKKVPVDEGEEPVEDDTPIVVGKP